MEAGRLRHRIEIDSKVSAQDATGDPVPTWVPWATRVPAEIAAFSGREFFGMNQILAQATAKITIRYRPGIDATMRIRHTVGGVEVVYNILGVLPDNESGVDSITMPVSRGTNKG